jgi:alkylation response protein AidB-like acyl-CoA dehydrogenase
MLGTPVDLSKITADAYGVGGIADHISPWQATYRSARLLGGKDNRYVLSTNGHIAVLVNPPGNLKASFRAGAVAKYYCTVKGRNVCRLDRDVLGRNGIVLDFHVMRHLCDMDALVTYEGTAEIQSLIVGRHVTGQSAFA